jgi:hypothetical protein
MKEAVSRRRITKEPMNEFGVLTENPLIKSPNVIPISSTIPYFRFISFIARLLFYGMAIKKK